MWKTPTHVTILSSLGKDFWHSSLEEFDKGLGCVPSLSIMPLVSYGDKELCRDMGGALHHIYPWLNYRPPLGNTAAINTPADRRLVKAEDIFWRVVQDLCHPKLFPPISVFAYPHKANPLCHLLCNIFTWELYHLGVLWWCSAVQWCSEETKRSKLIKQITSMTLRDWNMHHLENCRQVENLGRCKTSVLSKTVSTISKRKW